MGRSSYKVTPQIYRNPLGKVLNDWLMYSYDPMTKKKKKKDFRSGFYHNPVLCASTIKSLRNQEISLTF